MLMFFQAVMTGFLKEKIHQCDCHDCHDDVTIHKSRTDDDSMISNGVSRTRDLVRVDIVRDLPEMICDDSSEDSCTPRARTHCPSIGIRRRRFLTASGSSTRCSVKSTVSCHALELCTYSPPASRVTDQVLVPRCARPDHRA